MLGERSGLKKFGIYVTFIKLIKWSSPKQTGQQEFFIICFWLGIKHIKRLMSYLNQTLKQQ
ncbi:hypothetical protein C6H66_24365 [Photorhabdus hindustanensis]|uniref:Uncharacterized protein n=1 Tax=Photorhabdus hindustanensis TaxID=2918802 RepID=A0A2S8PTZ7_9GAMM|nr:hypothetical protein C6H66_24365 [Photorhabdus hindustanensis]